eukprot:UN29150
MGINFFGTAMPALYIVWHIICTVTEQPYKQWLIFGFVMIRKFEAFVFDLIFRNFDPSQNEIVLFYAYALHAVYTAVMLNIIVTEWWQIMILVAQNVYDFVDGWVRVKKDHGLDYEIRLQIISCWRTWRSGVYVPPAERKGHYKYAKKTRGYFTICILEIIECVSLVSYLI